MFSLCDRELETLEKFMPGEREVSSEELRIIKDACRRIMERYEVVSKQWGGETTGGGSIKFFIAKSRYKYYFSGYQYIISARREPGHNYVDVLREPSAQKSFGLKSK